MFIDDPRKWRLSMSGYSIKTGWSDDKKVIAKYAGATAPLDKEAFNEWLENAKTICRLYNALLDVSQSQSVTGQLTATQTNAKEKWEPMTTAPRDECVMVWLPNYGMQVAIGTFDPSQNRVLWWCRGVNEMCYPSHWRPLPLSPMEGAGDEGLEKEQR